MEITVNIPITIIIDSIVEVIQYGMDEGSLEIKDRTDLEIEVDRYIQDEIDQAIYYNMIKFDEVYNVVEKELGITYNGNNN